MPKSPKISWWSGSSTAATRPAGCHQNGSFRSEKWWFTSRFGFFSAKFSGISISAKTWTFPQLFFCARIVFTTGFHNEIFWWNESVRSIWAKSESNDTWFHYISLCFNMFQWDFDVHDISGNWFCLDNPVVFPGISSPVQNDHFGVYIPTL